jgi:hypothetical protein
MVAHDRTRLMADSFFIARGRELFNAVEATAALRALSKIKTKKKTKKNSSGRDGVFKKTI